MQTENLKRTPLYNRHVELGGKIVPFAGWELPVQYSGVIPEHQAVRERAGLFDVSHMGEVFVTGPEAEKAIDFLTCNDVKTLTDGKAQYSAIINEKGGVVDDIIVYRYSARKYLICVNASNSDKDFQWFLDHNRFDADFTNKSARYGQIALQGPRAVKILSSLPGLGDIGNLQYFHFQNRDVVGSEVIVARTGYTGEDGYELFIPWDDTVKIWDAVLEAGMPEGLVPAGLGARDSLRLEACLPLHGHELGDDISAYESGLGWIVKLNKGDFFGKEALAQQRTAGAPRGLVGFYVEDAGIVRHGDKLFSEAGEEIGLTTSGTKTPTVNRALGLGIVKSAFVKEGTPLFAEVRGRKLRCQVVKKPFYKRPSA
ncbi:MAG: glycine cleavage system aminomethyltransferase GcvT [Deltaproteobacteria bacterium]|nr:glycine cleavage system aminomethyltransferase GcvT [Deltaproteobacteria bacterium]